MKSTNRTIVLSLLFISTSYPSYLSRGLLTARQQISHDKNRLCGPSRTMVTGTEPTVVVAVIKTLGPVAGPAAAVTAVATVPLAYIAETIAPGKVPGAKSVKNAFKSLFCGETRSHEELVAEYENKKRARQAYLAAGDQAGLDFPAPYIANINPPIPATPPITVPAPISTRPVHARPEPTPRPAICVPVVPVPAPTTIPVSTPPTTQSQPIHSTPSREPVDLSPVKDVIIGAGGGTVGGALVAGMSKVIASKGSIILGGKATTTTATFTAGKSVVLFKSSIVIGGKAATVATATSTTTAGGATIAATAPGWLPWIWALACAHPIPATIAAAATAGTAGYGAYQGYKYVNAKPSSGIEDITSLKGKNSDVKNPKNGKDEVSSPDIDRIKRTDVELFDALKDIKKNYEYNKTNRSYKLKDRAQPIQKGVEELKIDEAHWEFEAYDKRGVHIGAIDPVTREFYKEAKLGRTIAKSKR